MRLSVVTTMYRSAPYLREFHARAAAAAARLSIDVEFVYVNDGSPDDALAVALDLRREYGNVRVVDLSRNFGHHPAMMAGLAQATGDLVFLIDCDLEEPPELLETFAAHRVANGADVVYGVQQSRNGGPVDRFLGWAFYRAYNALTTDPIPANLMTVRLMTRRYVAALLSHPETEFTISGLWARTGFVQVPVSVDKRRKPATSYSLRRKIGLLVRSVTAFSSKPLHYIFGLGVVMLGLSLAAAGVLVARRVLFGDMLEGWPSLMVSLWVLGGLIIFCQGVIGIYLARVYAEVKRRPATITREVFEPRAEPAVSVIQLRRSAGG
jgi:putative glycosyltransferase